MKETLSHRINTRYKGQNISLHIIDDYSVCASGDTPLMCVRLLSHGRCARQQRSLSSFERWIARGVLPHLIPGEWCEVTIQSPA